MSKRNDLDVIRKLTVDDKERKAWQRKAPDGAMGTRATDANADGGVFRDELERSLYLSPESISKTRTLALVPTDLCAKLLFREDRCPPAFSPVEQIVLDTTSYVSPIGRHDGSGIDGRATSLNLGDPLSIDILGR